VSIGVRGKPVRICRACVREAARRYRDRRAGAVA
jgi:hypothetical protein